MRCDECEFWVPSDDWDVKAGGLRRCSAVREKWRVEDEVPEAAKDAKCDEEYDDGQLSGLYAQASGVVFGRALAVVNDGSQYKAELLTRPDFGCVLFKRKE